MSEKCGCKNSEGICQEWPKDGKMKENMNTTLNTLKRRFENEDGMVYAYVLTTVEGDGYGGFIQTGSAPNFQGDFITLCTCKHWMRTWKTTDAWKDVWIAGFTGVNILGDYRNYLFYLMQVQEAFQSHKELWNWLDSTVKQAKNASHHRCGDVYEHTPNLKDLKDRFNPVYYYEPVKKHVHFQNDEWRRDINLNTRTNKHPALLVGNPDLSFLWSQPKIYSKDKLPRTKKWNNMGDFIQSLVGK
jgi:hypothetical protein